MKGEGKKKTRGNRQGEKKFKPYIYKRKKKKKGGTKGEKRK